MTEVSAKIVLDSVSPDGIRLTTAHLRYPRFIHAELMTHRVFSRNARSSRAVPVKTMLEEIAKDPVVPLFWGKNQKGMQATEECNEPIDFGSVFRFRHPFTITREQAWRNACEFALDAAKAFADAGYHKQVVNRLLEPFMHIDVLVTATEWANFFALRDHKDAEPHIELLAQRIKRVFDASTPGPLKPGQWHLPYIAEADYDAAHTAADENDTDPGIQLLQKISAARCARISYKPFDGNGSIEKELERYHDLITSKPMHASPVEHQATPDQRCVNADTWVTPGLHGNFRGWIQFRKTLRDEAVW